MTFLNKLNQKTLINIEISNPSKCPYIDDKIETKMFINLAEFPEKHDQLAVSGFRRVENYAYKPICQNCNACIPIRIIPQQISLTKSQKRCLNRNSNINRKIAPCIAKEKHYNLFIHYQNHRHKNGQMSKMSWKDYSSMINSTPIHSIILEYSNYKRDLIGIMVLDIQKDGLSAVYSFYHSRYLKNSLGLYMILDAINYTNELKLKYLYLGYLINENPKMSYKNKFNESEILKNGQWEKLI